MARLIVWAKADERYSNAIYAVSKYSRGEVVDIVEDGQEVGRDVEASEWWRVVDVPGKTRAELQLFLGADPIAAVEVLRAKLPRKRVYKVDLDALERLHGLTPRQQPSRSLHVSKVTPVLVDPKPDPRVIGQDGIG